MPLGIVSDSDFESELNRTDSKLVEDFHGKIEDSTRASVIDIESGRGHTPEVPESLRKLIGETALTEPNSEVAKAFGVSESSVSAYKNGSTSTASYNRPEADLSSYINDKRELITKKARTRLLAALNSITPEKLAEVKVKDAAGIAKDMSAVIKNIEPQQKSGSDNNIQFVFFAPKTREESDYPIINVEE